MKQLNFKNYPPRVLISLIVIIAAVIIFIKQAFSRHTFDWGIFIMEWATIGIIVIVLTLVNKYLMWGRFLNVLGLTDVRGKYKGELVSSFRRDDDENKDNIEMIIELEIVQNINGIKVFGRVLPKVGFEGKTSDFESEWCNLQALENGNYLLEYRYSNRSVISHSWHKRYNLSSHTGFASLIYSPKDKTMEGFYFTYENQSRGKLNLSLNK